MGWTDTAAMLVSAGSVMTPHDTVSTVNASGEKRATQEQAPSRSQAKLRILHASHDQ